MGPGTLRVTRHDDTIRGQAWGPGADWLLDRLPELLGAADDPSAFVPRHKLLALTHHRLPGLRLLRTGLVLESLIPSILEQKVTTGEAYRAWRLLVRKFGVPAPGPAPERMAVMPAPRTWALIPSWEWHRAGVDDKRASTVLRAVRSLRGWRRRRGCPGGGAGAAGGRAGDRALDVCGDGAAESWGGGLRDGGDVHLPGIVGWALAGIATPMTPSCCPCWSPTRGSGTVRCG